MHGLTGRFQPHPVTSVVAIDAILKQQQVGDVVDGEGPDISGRQWYREGDSVVSASGCIQRPVL